MDVEKSESIAKLTKSNAKPESNEVIWSKYLAYLADWRESHKDPGFYGMTPACFDEWLGCEYLQNIDGQADGAKDNRNDESKKSLSFDSFIIERRLLDEACRQWCDFIDEAPERRTGQGFTEFCQDICGQKYIEHMRCAD